MTCTECFAEVLPENEWRHDMTHDESRPTFLKRGVHKERHLCGCFTVFDTVAWTSRVLESCDFHRQEESA